MKRYPHFFAAIAAVLAMSAAAACGPKAPKAPAHLVFIGLDGMSAEKFQEADMPFIKSLRPQSSYTLKKRSVLPSSSAVNWASMWMGAGPELHGYTTWGSKTPDLPSRVVLKNGIFPTVFQLYRDANPDAEMGCFSEWDGINYVVDTLSFSVFGQPDSGEKYDIVSLTDMAAGYLETKAPDMAVIVYDCPDHQGHKYGWSSPEYSAALTQLDSAVHVLFDTVERAGYKDNTTFIITADHGGILRGHGGKTMSEMETPFIILGPGIRKGYCFDDISMMQFDVASTVAAMYSLQQPQVWIGRPVTSIFE